MPNGHEVPFWGHCSTPIYGGLLRALPEKHGCFPPRVGGLGGLPGRVVHQVTHILCCRSIVKVITSERFGRNEQSGTIRT